MLIGPPLPAVDPAVIIEQAGRGLLDPNLSQEERRGRAQWTLAQLGFAPTPLNPPGPQPPSTSSHKPPPAAGRTPGMTMQQWDALQVPSGGAPADPLPLLKSPSGRGLLLNPPQCLLARCLPKRGPPCQTSHCPLGLWNGKALHPMGA